MNEYRKYNDLELAALLKSDDYAAFTEIHERYYSLLYTHAMKKFPHREEVRDLLQELFAALWDTRHTLVFTSGLGVYLFSATRNRVISLFRRQKVRDTYVQSFRHFLDEGENLTEGKLHEKELLHRLEQEMAALPGQMRKVFELSRKEELSHQEIACLLNTSPLTVKKQIHNTRKILRTKLETTLLTLFF